MRRHCSRGSWHARRQAPGRHRAPLGAAPGLPPACRAARRSRHATRHPTGRPALTRNCIHAGAHMPGGGLERAGAEARRQAQLHAAARAGHHVLALRALLRARRAALARPLGAQAQRDRRLAQHLRAPHGRRLGPRSPPPAGARTESGRGLRPPRPSERRACCTPAPPGQQRAAAGGGPEPVQITPCAACHEAGGCGARRRGSGGRAGGQPRAGAAHLGPGQDVEVRAPGVHVKAPGPGLLQRGRARHHRAVHKVVPALRARDAARLRAPRAALAGRRAPIRAPGAQAARRHLLGANRWALGAGRAPRARGRPPQPARMRAAPAPA